MIYKIEKAKSKDSYFLYKIRNLDDIRKFSSNTSKIELQNHNKWFNKNLKLKGNFFYILKINTKKISNRSSGLESKNEMRFPNTDSKI